MSTQRDAERAYARMTQANRAAERARATHCTHCGVQLTVDDHASLGVCARDYQDVMDRTERRGRYAPRAATEPTKR